MGWKKIKKKYSEFAETQREKSRQRELKRKADEFYREQQIFQEAEQAKEKIKRHKKLSGAKKTIQRAREYERSQSSYGKFDSMMGSLNRGLQPPKGRRSSSIYGSDIIGSSGSGFFTNQHFGGSGTIGLWGPYKEPKKRKSRTRYVYKRVKVKRR